MSVTASRSQAKNQRVGAAAGFVLDVLGLAQGQVCAASRPRDASAPASIQRDPHSTATVVSGGPPEQPASLRRHPVRSSHRTGVSSLSPVTPVKLTWRAVTSGRASLVTPASRSSARSQSSATGRESATELAGVVSSLSSMYSSRRSASGGTTTVSRPVPHQLPAPRFYKTSSPPRPWTTLRPRPPSSVLFRSSPMTRSAPSPVETFSIDVNATLPCALHARSSVRSTRTPPRSS